MTIQIEVSDLELPIPGGKTWMTVSAIAFVNSRGRVTGIKFSGSNTIIYGDELEDGFTKQLFVWLSAEIAEQYMPMIEEKLEEHYWDKKESRADQLYEMGV